jgi:hypothetical protein
MRPGFVRVEPLAEDKFHCEELFFRNSGLDGYLTGNTGGLVACITGRGRQIPDLISASSDWLASWRFRDICERFDSSLVSKFEAIEVKKCPKVLLAVRDRYFVVHPQLGDQEYMCANPKYAMKHICVSAGLYATLAANGLRVVSRDLDEFSPR